MSYHILIFGRSISSIKGSRQGWTWMIIFFIDKVVALIHDVSIAANVSKLVDHAAAIFYYDA